MNTTNTNTVEAVCTEEGCLAGASNKDGLCSLHHAIRVARVRCEGRRCKVTCTRGRCWRKVSR